MGNDFRPNCQVEGKKVLWLIGFVLFSALIIQYFELPYRDRMFSLLSSGKSYFSPSNDGAIIGNKGKQSYLNNISSPPTLKSKQYFPPEDTMEMMIERSISIAPAKASEKSYNLSEENVVGDVSPPSFFAVPPEKFSTQNIIISPSPNSIEYNNNNNNNNNNKKKKKNNKNKNNNNNNNARIAPSPSVSQRNVEIEIGAPIVDCNPPTSERSEIDGAPISYGHDSSITISPPPPPPKELHEKPEEFVVTISEMNDMLLHSRASSFSKSSLWRTSADQELLDARLQIENGAVVRDHPGLYSPIYRNLSTFLRSYEIMEQKLKVYIYKDGKRPVFHQRRLRGIYASEGWFMKHMKASDQFVTNNPGEAHLFYLPFSSQLLVENVYVPDSHTFHDIIEFLKNYIDTIKTKYPFWNRTDGTDHFLVACHDWAPVETKRHMANCIRALCNADVKEGFQLGKDVSLPETSVSNPLRETSDSGRPPADRKILAFFAGQMHGHVRPILLKYWLNKSTDMMIFGRLKRTSYVWHMKNSKYWVCAKGYEVNIPRVVEAIIYGCVPVILSDNFVPPFFDVLNWESFAVFVLERDIPRLRDILVSISESRYVVMQKRVKQVRQHFMWHNVPVKYDIFHMILHSVWYNRVMRLPRE